MGDDDAGLLSDQGIGFNGQVQMWAVENHTPFSAERNWFVDKDGAKSWIVAVKAAYDVLPDGITAISARQDPVLLSEEFSGEPGKSSILYDSDLSGPKQRTDVLLNAHAYARAGGTATVVDVEISVGPLRKTLQVSGDRKWDSLLGAVMMTDPEPFARMPICYERAFGGFDVKSNNPGEHSFEPRNPIGTGFANKASHVVGVPAPNVEYPRDRVSSWKDHPRPAGLSALFSYWVPRRDYAGTYDEHWMKHRFPLWPEDFDSRFFQCAPEDQQVEGFLRGGESVRLRNLTPDGLLEFQLPRFYPVFATYLRGKRVEHRAKLHTLVIEPDRYRILMVWHTSLRIQSNADDLDITVIREKMYL